MRQRQNMVDDSKKEALRLFFQMNRIPLFLYVRDELVFALPEDRQILSADALDYFRGKAKKQALPEGQPAHFELLPYHIMTVTDLGHGETLVFGPGIPLRNYPEQVRSILRDPPYSSCSEELSAWFLTAPTVQVPDYFNALSLAVYLCCGKFPPTKPHLEEDETNRFNAEVLRSYSRDVVHAQEEEVFHVPQEFEEAITDAISKGDFDMLKTRSLTLESGVVRQMSSSPIQHERYYYVMLVTIFARAAVRGGMDYESASMLSDDYILRMDALSSVLEIELLRNQMVKDFCERVHEIRMPQNLSLTTRICREYISRNIHKRITLSDLAAACGQESHAVSRKFRQDTGVKITTYINRVKMNEAAHLLRYSSHSLSTISSLLGYSSQSYFNCIFREEYHMTPLQYRNAGAGQDTAD